MILLLISVITMMYKMDWKARGLFIFSVTVCVTVVLVNIIMNVTHVSLEFILLVIISGYSRFQNIFMGFPSWPRGKTNFYIDNSMVNISNTLVILQVCSDPQISWRKPTHICRVPENSYYSRVRTERSRSHMAFKPYFK